MYALVPHTPSLSISANMDIDNARINHRRHNRERGHNPIKANQSTTTSIIFLALNALLYLLFLRVDAILVDTRMLLRDPLKMVCCKPPVPSGRFHMVLKLSSIPLSPYTSSQHGRVFVHTYRKICTKHFSTSIKRILVEVRSCPVIPFSPSSGHMIQPFEIPHPTNATIAL